MNVFGSRPRAFRPDSCVIIPFTGRVLVRGQGEKSQPSPGKTCAGREGVRLPKDEQQLHAGHRKRMRERLLREGMDSLQDHEVLEILLFFAIPRQDTNELAHRLLLRFHTLSGVFDAPFEELRRVEGVGETAALLLKSYPEVERRCRRDRKKSVKRLYSYEEIMEYAQSWLAGRSREAILLVLTDAAGRVLFSGIIHEGSVGAAEIYFRELVRLASSYDAACAVLAHNHPSGDCLPSRDDLETTRLAADALSRVNVTLLDHVIVAGDHTLSLALSGAMDDVFPDAEAERERQRQRQKVAERPKRRKGPAS